MLTAKKNEFKGAEFLIKNTDHKDVYTPEQITDEQKMISDTARDFFKKEVHPVIERLEVMEDGLTLEIMKKAGDLGFLGISVPQEYGGMEFDFNTETYFYEQMGISMSFGLSLGAHIGIGTLPILYFGNESQKAHYLPRIATGEIKCAYCLTEPTSGSDALSAKTKAILSDDEKHYIVNGQKMWITNAGFADLFTVFVQVNGDQFSGLLIDANSEGITLGEEEKKMGVKGSSTRQVFFENVKVPVGNLLGEVGKGHRIAFNVLNIGRFKLCNSVTGGAKSMFNYALKYANERIQFNKPIAQFGAIQHKLALMASKIYASESAVYRCSGMINDMVADLVSKGEKAYVAKQKAAEEYAIECALLKVYGSETADFVVDESLQIYGGMGYSEEMPVSRGYRDSRINRIYEGTNEINRLLSIGMVMKRAMKGQIDLMGSAMTLQQDLMNDTYSNGQENNSVLKEAKNRVNMAKKAWLLVAGSAAQTLMAKLEEEQEVVMLLSDMAMEIYMTESALLRSLQLIDKHGENKCSAPINITNILSTELLDKCALWGKQALAGFAEGDTLKMYMGGLKKLCKYIPVNQIKLRREIANYFSQKGIYDLNRDFRY